MKKLIIAIVLAILTANNLYADKEHFYEEALTQVSKIQGLDVRTHLNASYHVAKMWKEWPSADFHERISCYMGYGGAESGFEKNYIHFNIPNKPYPGLHGLKVKKFSVDYSWAGLNQEAVNPTYAVAKAIQDGRSLSRRELMQLGLRPDLMMRLKPILHIPKDLQLYKIDLSTAIEAKKQYDAQRKLGVRPKKIKIDVLYVEDDQDKLDSVLLYRTIEEFDRSLRGWPYQTWNSDAYRICIQILNN